MKKSHFKMASVLAVVGGLCANANAQELLLESIKITAPDGASFDQFGQSVAIEGRTVLVGAPFDDDRGNDSGSAYVFDSQSGAFIDKLLFDRGVSRDNFGESVALKNGNMLVGAPNSPIAGTRAGAASVFRNNQQINTLTPFVRDADPTGFASIGYSTFGFSVNLSSDGTTMVAGARSDTGQLDAGSRYGGGAMYIFSNGNRQKVFASDAGFGDNFGHSVATTNTVAVGSSPFDDNNGIDFGSIYVFDTATGIETFKIRPTDTLAGDHFGWSVAIEGNVIAAGAPLHDAAGPGAGAVYLFDAINGQQLNKITLPGATSFGIRVAMDDSRLVVGSVGSAYVFDVGTGSLIAELQPSDPTLDSRFGWTIAVDGNTVLVAAEGDPTNGEQAGAVYIFDLAGGTEPVDPPQDPEPIDPPQDPFETVGIQTIQTGSYIVQRRNGRIREGAEVTVVVVDDQGLPVQGALVTVELTGRIDEIVSGVTGLEGFAVLRSAQTRRTSTRALTYTVCVTDIDSPLTYDPETNAETCATH